MTFSVINYFYRYLSIFLQKVTFIDNFSNIAKSLCFRDRLCLSIKPYLFRLHQVISDITQLLRNKTLFRKQFFYRYLFFYRYNSIRIIKSRLAHQRLCNSRLFRPQSSPYFVGCRTLAIIYIYFQNKKLFFHRRTAIQL